MSSSRIVWGTALAKSTPLILGEHFDIVVVDEAGQISQPGIIGPLMAANFFLLVRDHKQLSPLVQSDSIERASTWLFIREDIGDK